VCPSRPPNLVALQLPPRELASAVRQVWQEGDAALPLDPALAPGALTGILHEMRPARLISSARDVELIEGRPIEPGTALVVLTSGTTGRPRGVELTHEALKAAGAAGLRRLGVSGEDRWLSCLPLHHIGGLQVLVRSALMGSVPVMHDRFDPAAIARAEGVNLISLVPTMLLRLLDAGVELARFKSILLGGGAGAPSLIDRARAVGAKVVQTYGMTETCGGVVYEGVPLDGVLLSISPEGLIALGGPVLMRGYRNRTDLTSSVLRDGWFHTADVGHLDGGGRLVVLGRVDEMIITGGKKVAPGQVAAILSGHPEVKEAAVFGIPDDVWGERVVAAVVPSSGASPTLGQLRAHVASRTDAFQAPREVIMVAALPRLPSGKVDRAALARLSRRPRSNERSALDGD
jgi:o-succinylbenzoate---CoA ligase